MYIDRYIYISIYIYIYIYTHTHVYFLIWLLRVLIVALGILVFVATCRTFSCGMWDLVP